MEVTTQNSPLAVFCLAQIKEIRQIIDAHFEKKHSGYMNDQRILELVEQLNNKSCVPEDENGGYQYFATDLYYESKKYRLVWLLEDSQLYIGVIKAYRRK